MNEFIVWDKKKNKMVGVDTLFISEAMFRPLGGDEYVVFNYDNEYFSKPFQYIGKTDINGKKIYADCSIVEFNNSTNKNHKYKGVFYYLESELKYKIKVFNLDGTIGYWNYNSKDILNIKIIGHIYE